MIRDPIPAFSATTVQRRNADPRARRRNAASLRPFAMKEAVMTINSQIGDSTRVETSTEKPPTPLASYLGIAIGAAMLAVMLVLPANASTPL